MPFADLGVLEELFGVIAWLRKMVAIIERIMDYDRDLVAAAWERFEKKVYEAWKEFWQEVCDH